MPGARPSLSTTATSLLLLRRQPQAPPSREAGSFFGHDLLFCFPPELEVGLPALQSRKPTGRIVRQAAADVRNSIGSPLAAARPTARR
jgi:hypothetical protein